MYLAKTDYTISIAYNHLDEILAAAIAASGKTDDVVRKEAEDTAEARIRAYTSFNYDIATEFTKENTDPTRARMVIQCMVDISLYHLHMTINPRNIPKLREQNHEMCIATLEEIRAGKMSLVGVAALPDATRQDYTVIKSQRKFVSKPFTDRAILDGDTL